MRLTILGLAVALTACGDPGYFTPAKTANEHKKTEDRATLATREDVATCEYMGDVEAHGGDLKTVVSRTAANHGATHYVLTDSYDRLEGTRTTVYVNPALNTAVASTTEMHDTRLMARAYHCP